MREGIEMAKKYDKLKLIADYKTGAFTQRELAHEYKISVAMVAKITKSIEKESEQLVNSKIAIEHALTFKSEQEVNAINNVVNRELARKAKAQVLEGFLDDGVGVAINKGINLLNSDDATMQDVAQFGKFQNDARVGLDLQPKFSTSQTFINNQNAQQNNSLEKIEIEFIE